MDQKRKLFECSIRNHVSNLGYYLAKTRVISNFPPRGGHFSFFKLKSKL